MALQTFTLDEEMSLIVEACVQMRVVHKIEISMDHASRPYAKMVLVSVPTREGGWIYVGSLDDFVRVMAAEPVMRWTGSHLGDAGKCRKPSCHCT